MTNNISANNERKTDNTNRAQIFLLVIVCISLLIVSFMAFLKIENNLHALLVFTVGTALNVFIFMCGMNQAKN